MYKEKRTLRPIQESERDSLKDRLLELIGSSSANSFANYVGLSEGTIRNLLKGAMPRTDNLISIANASGVTVEWLATGRGEKAYSDGLVSGLVSSVDSGSINNEFAYINMYDAEVSMGSGAWNDDERIIYPLAFRKDWLSAEGINPEQCVAIVARGDSMEETIKDGATLLVDLTSNSIGRDGVYVIRFDGHLLAKRLQRSFDGSVLIKSDNPAYSEIKVPKEQAEELHVIGRVVWHASVI